MRKKSQVTLFIIFGIVILGAVATALFVYYGEEDIVTELKRVQIFYTKIKPVKTYIQTCVDETGYEGLKKIGLQGGYTEVPDYISYQDTALWYLEERNIQPLLNETKMRLAEYVNENLKRCINASKYYREEGFFIEYDELSSDVTFGADDVTLKVTFPVKIRYGPFEQSYEEFIKRYDVRFRKIWELASKYENRFFSPDFDHKKPLEGVNPGSFIVTIEPQSAEDYLVYRIEDRQSYVFGKNDYVFRFAFKNGPSTLTRTVSLQENCDKIPNYRPQIIYSLDRDAQLFIRPMTTFNMPGGSCEISINQSYERMAISPYQNYQYNDQQLFFSFQLTGVIARTLTHPVYDIEPTGTISSQPMRLKLYWDQDYSPIVGPVGILAKHGVEPWWPIDSNPVYSENYAWTEINGFTEFTLLDCGVQMPIQSKVKATAKPEWPCFIMSFFGAGGGFYEGDKNCIDFTPTCDGLVTVTKKSKDGEGSCAIQSKDNFGEVYQGIVRFSQGLTALIEGIQYEQEIAASQSLLAEYGSGNLLSEGVNDPGDFIRLVNSFMLNNLTIRLSDSRKPDQSCNDPDSSKECCSQAGGSWYRYTDRRNGVVSNLCSDIPCTNNCTGAFSLCSEQGCAKPCSSDAACSGIRECSKGGCIRLSSATCVGVDCNYHGAATAQLTSEAEEDPKLTLLLQTYLESQTSLFESGEDLNQEELASLFAGFLSSSPEVLEGSSYTVEDAVSIFNGYLTANPQLFRDAAAEAELREQPDFISALMDMLKPVVSLATLFADLQTKWLEGGHTYQVCSKIKGCDTGWGAWNCKKCSLDCTAIYR